MIVLHWTERKEQYAKRSGLQISLDEIRSLTPEVVRQMGDMLSKDKVPPMVKVRIMEIILERTYGKPETSIKLTNAQQNVEAAQERIAAIVENIRKRREEEGE